MSRGMKEAKLSEDLCASMVAIALCLHVVTSENTNEELCASDLLSGIKQNFESHASDFKRLNEVFPPFRAMFSLEAAVEQGLKLFKSAISELGVEVIDKKGDQGVFMTQEFIDLLASLGVAMGPHHSP